MGRRPTPKHTLDRKNGKKGYSPDNCRWATKSEQNRNRRTSRMLTIGGKKQCLAAWAEQVGVDLNVIYMRLTSGWTPRDAVFRPVQKKLRRKNAKSTLA
jgi:hypothetical protein